MRYGIIFPPAAVRRPDRGNVAPRRFLSLCIFPLQTAGDFVFALEYEPWNGGHIYGDGHHISFFFRCELLDGNQITTPELPDIDPLNPVMVSQPVWLPVLELPEIELLPHINKNLLQYFKTGEFEPLFLDEPYENR